MAYDDTKLRRSSSDKVVAGVVGGIARYFSFDPTLARVLYVIASVISAAFPGILVYLVLWVVMPKDSEVSPGMMDEFDRQV